MKKGYCKHAHPRDNSTGGKKDSMAKDLKMAKSGAAGGYSSVKSS